MKKNYFLNTLLFIYFGVCVNAQAEQPIYKRVMPNGEVKYSNQPGPGAERVEILPMPAPQPMKSPPVFEMPEKAIEAGPEHYEVKFSTPQNEQTFTVGEPTVDVSLTTNPELYSTDKIQLFLDNLPYGDLQSELTYSISDLDRGAHSLQAKIVSDSKPNKIKGETGVIVVYIQKPSIQLPPH